MRLKEVPVDLRPREKAMRIGVNKLSDHELIMLVLRHGNAVMSVSQIAHNLLIKTENLKKLESMSIEELMGIEGIKMAKALEIKAILELSKRVSRAQVVYMNVMENSNSVISWLQKEIGHKNQECFLVLFLNVANQIIHYDIIFKGTLDRSLVHPREIFNEAIKVSANTIIAVHNHPGGTLIPSEMDYVVTKALIEAGQLVGIELVDHLIVTKNGYHSIMSDLTRAR